MKRNENEDRIASKKSKGKVVNLDENMNLHAGHRQRVRERFVQEGLDNFHDYQVLELLLFYAQPYRDVNDLAHILLRKYGSLSAVFEANINDLMQVKGVGYNTAVFLNLIPAIVHRYQMDKWRDKKELNSTGEVGQYAVSLFSGRVNEAFFLICLNTQNKINSVELVAEGTINEVVVQPRMLVEAVLRSQSKSVVLTHNHPGGSLKPSANDIELTKKVAAVLKAISVKVLDHVIVSNGQYYSFAEKGLMQFDEKGNSFIIGNY